MPRVFRSQCLRITKETRAEANNEILDNDMFTITLHPEPPTSATTTPFTLLGDFREIYRHHLGLQNDFWKLLDFIQTSPFTSKGHSPNCLPYNGPATAAIFRLSTESPSHGWVT